MKGSFREQYSAQDLRRRNEYIENSLEVIYEELDDPTVAQLIGGEVTKLSSIVYHAVATDIIKGIVQLPEDLPEGTGLAVAAIKPDQSFGLSPAYWSQTDSQKAKTLGIIEGWGPRESAESFYDERIGWISEQHSVLELGYYGAHAVSLANTGVFSEKSLDAHFYQPPNNSLAIIKYRPLLVLTMEPGTKHANADSIAHQLVHIRQIEDQPLVAVESQTSFDLPAMREELEAYHVGATLALRRLKHIGTSAVHSDSHSESVNQIVIDMIRDNTVAPEDPYRPSVELKAALSRLMDDSEVHTQFNFEDTWQYIRRLEAGTDF